MNISKLISAFVLIIGFGALFLLREMHPFIRLLYVSVGLIWIIKFAALFWQISNRTQLSFSGLAAFSLWPDVSFYGFAERKKEPISTTGNRFLEPWICFFAGASLLLVVSVLFPGFDPLILNYIALVSILLMLHLGLVEIMAEGFRLLGFAPSTLFDRPYMSRSLQDFWSVRWNLSFVHMNKIFLLRPLSGKLPPRLLVFLIFLVSGILHEVGISFADGKSFGRPLSYFIIQGIGMTLEKKIRFPRLLLWLWILLPLPLLFTPDFVNLFLGALRGQIALILLNISLREFLHTGLIVGGFAHLLVLVASVQVPARLNWKIEFQRLSSLNRKVFWTYGGYIFGTIVFFSMSSLVLSRDLQSNTATILWSGFISVFWWARLMTDFFYMKHEDWPVGPLFRIGHVCLTTLFIFLALLYTTIAAILFLNA